MTLCYLMLFLFSPFAPFFDVRALFFCSLGIWTQDTDTDTDTDSAHCLFISCYSHSIERAISLLDVVIEHWMFVC